MRAAAPQANLNPVSASTSDIELSAVALDCPSIIPSFNSSIEVNAPDCPYIGIDFTSKVTHQNPGNSGNFDNTVTGVAGFGGYGAQCISVTTALGMVCSFTLYGQIDVAFNEAPKGTAPNPSQELTFTGTLNVTTPSGLIDFTPHPLDHARDD